MIVLDVRDLTAMSGATRAQLAARSEAASVVLWRFHTGTAPRTRGSWKRSSPSHGEARATGLEDDRIEVEVHWDEPTRAVIAASRNELKNVERAAEAIAIALADQLGFRVIGEVHHGSGADWLMIPKGEPDNDYYKLEVSGIARMETGRPEDRLREKVLQARGGDLRRPGVAVVVRFEDVRILSETW